MRPERELLERGLGRSLCPSESAAVFLNAKEAASYLRVKISTIYAWVHQKRIPFRKHGSRLIFSTTDLHAWSERQVIHALPSWHFEQSNSKKISAKNSSLKTESNTSKPESASNIRS